ncbi:MAG: PDDEXK nuclease domain-containing protein [Bacteroidota bacterium]
MTRQAILTSEYPVLLAELKQRISAARFSAARAVNSELMFLYWDIGQRILEAQQSAPWGSAVVEKLASDLRSAFPEIRGFSANNLWMMRQLYAEYSESSFLEQAVQFLSDPKNGPLEQPVQVSGSRSSPKRMRDLHRTFKVNLLAQVPWGHHIEILKKVKAPAERLYYLSATARFGWSRRVLLNQIKSDAYGRTISEKKTHNFDVALTEHHAEQAEEMLKSRYNLEFLGINQAVKERELEDRLITQLQSFILELGYGFCFVGRQFRLALGSKEYFVDLLFYHRFLKALVAIDLKIGSFEPEHSGKMDFYLNLLNEKERAPEDQPSIGIILCAEKDDVEVEFALKTKNNPIGVAEYQLNSTLPAELKKKLPTSKQLVAAMRDILAKEK